MFQMINEFSSILKSFTASFAMERTLVLLVRFNMALIMMFRSQLGRTLWAWVEVMTTSSDGFARFFWMFQSPSAPMMYAPHMGLHHISPTEVLFTSVAAILLTLRSQLIMYIQHNFTSRKQVYSRDNSMAIFRYTNDKVHFTYQKLF